MDDIWKDDISPAQVLPRNYNDEDELDTLPNKWLQEGLDAEIVTTWDNQPIDHEPVRVHMQWYFERLIGRPHKRVVKIEFEAPLFDDEPPSDFPGICKDLWNYECVELFFANDKKQYLEVEVGPHGHWLILLFKGPRDCIDDGEEIELEVENVFDGDKWRCKMEIPLAYFPQKMTKFNIYALHGTGPDRHYEALFPMWDGKLDKPDFHRLEYFGRLDTRRIIPEGYNKTPFNDLKYGDMWEEVTRPRDPDKDLQQQAEAEPSSSLEQEQNINME